MKIVLPTLLLLLASYNSFAQEDSILKNFKYRIDHYQAVGITASAGGQYLHQKTPVSTLIKQDGASASTGLSYLFIKSTDRLLLTADGGLGVSYNGSRNLQTNTNTRNSYLYPNYNVSVKWYNPRNSFFELGSSGYISRNTIKTITDPAGTHIKNVFGAYQLGVTIGVGKGRLENVTDMQNALWLYKTLQEEQKITRSLSYDELFQLGQTITKANNTRVLDARRRTRYLLKTIDSYLEGNNLLSSHDIDYFTALNDIAFFAINEPRYSGTEKFIRLTPYVSGNYNTQFDKLQVTEQRNNRFNKAAELSIGVNRYRPLNLKHQINYGASLLGNYISFRDKMEYYSGGSFINSQVNKSSLKQAGINLFYEHAIYPNTRTSIKFGVNADAGVQSYTGNSTEYYQRVSLYSNFNYFISNRVRFTGTLSAGYNKNIYDYKNFYSPVKLTNGFQINGNAGIIIGF